LAPQDIRSRSTPLLVTPTFTTVTSYSAVPCTVNNKCRY